MYLLIVFVVIGIALTLPVKLVLHIENTEITASAVILRWFCIRRRFLIQRVSGKIYTLEVCRKGKKKEKANLRDLIQKARNRQLSDSEKYARKRAVDYILRHIDLSVRAYMQVGFLGAFASAMIAGLANTVGSVIASMPSRIRKNVTVKTIPSFNRSTFSFFADCIIKVSPANIILGLLIRRIAQKRAKRGNTRSIK